MLRNLGLQPAQSPGQRPERVLEIRGQPEQRLRVRLENLRIDRGPWADRGSPSRAAGVWISHVEDSEIDGLQITGNGRGAGLVVLDADGLRIDSLHVHDMVWAPCPSDARRLLPEDVRAGWNEVLLQSMEDCTSQPGERLRIREPLAGVIIGRSRNVVLSRPLIQRLLARLSDGTLLPWQTDGMTIKTGPVDSSGAAVDSRIVIDAARIESVWEGIDVNGLPIRGVTVRNAVVRDVHAFGVKAANGVQDMVVDQTRVERAGLAGFVVSGDGDPRPRGPSTRRVRISNSTALDTGFGGRWLGQATIAGFRLMSTSRNASEVVLERFSARDTQASPTMSFGVHAECAGSLRVEGSSVHGATRAPVSIAGAPCH